MEEKIHKRFAMKDESFICLICGFEVEKLKYTARNHCPKCFSSIHLDVMPGDRQNACQGILEAIGIEQSKKGYKIVFRCQECKEIKKNKLAEDDNRDLFLKLLSNPLEY